MFIPICNRITLNILSTYACESLFSVINFINSRKRSSLTDETSSSCVSLKVTKYQTGVGSVINDAAAAEVLLLTHMKRVI